MYRYFSALYVLLSLLLLAFGCASQTQSSRKNPDVVASKNGSNSRNAASGTPSGYLADNSPTAGQSTNLNLPGDVPISLEMIASGFNRPVNLASSHDGTNRLFVVEQHGRIRIIKNGVVNATPYLDISSIVLSNGNEQGLLNVRFDPDYAKNGYFYINYTSIAGNGASVIARYKVSADPDIADPSSGKILLKFDQPFANHNGGSMNFGADGYLYLGFGDGGSGGDPYGNGQNLGVYLGKILRIDVNVADPQTYAIPANNPFVGNPIEKGEIWAYGLRNPWQFSFDRLTHDMYIADVGQDKWEEIDFQPSSSVGGENYGWNLMEGTHCYPSDPCTPIGTLPVAEYGHDQGCSITGIGVYRGAEYAKLDGIYFAGDYCSGRIWGLARNVSGVWVFKDVLDSNLKITGSGEDDPGNLYITSFTNPAGSVWKLVGK
jgi:glucose/arabinose dehydrogenase